MTLTVLAPVAGTVLALEDVPDAVFSEAMVGPGVAVDPDPSDRAEVRAPVAGTIAKLYPHAFAIVTEDGKGVLVHVGIDTVELGGEGFALHAEEKDTVTAGQLIVTFSPNAVIGGGRSAVVPILALDASADALALAAEVGEDIMAGEELFSWT
ncbi:PTS glucose transporter subunit IIA [Georgenia halophila]|uniref:PTS glucose transporter subunit IIA n=1 Tax=Georgenia halophila TaxID=620889 RepID=A0ABP8L544_9MICO